ncbi:hypothetical protein Y1Q_0009329 [Alligator mississippiensis]|uniref:Uncharacterized protein n=1 Tax=Alligator mississippiensis TaxID=8496 RepID=A0A151N7D1_ALLMI|nr:hypothetical protein Y1Q_0009329 [Alligator mississippiensis]
MSARFTSRCQEDNIASLRMVLISWVTPENSSSDSVFSNPDFAIAQQEIMKPGFWGVDTQKVFPPRLKEVSFYALKSNASLIQVRAIRPTGILLQEAR